MFESLLNAFRAPDIRRRILVVLGLLIVFRFLAAVPVPGVDPAQLANFLEGNPLFGLLNLLNWSMSWWNPDWDLTPGELADILSDLYLNGAGSD